MAVVICNPTQEFGVSFISSLIFKLPLPIVAAVLFFAAIFASPAIEGSSPPINSVSPEVRLQWFYTEGCNKCGEVKRLLAGVERAHAGALKVERLEITELANYKRMMALEGQYGIGQSAPMEVFVGDRFLLGHDQIIRDLERTVADVLARGATNNLVLDIKPEQFSMPERHLEPPPHHSSPFPLPSTADVLARLGPMVVVGAGLIDGVNPCAFATIVFLVSLLVARHFTPRQLLQAGLSFGVAVFIINFLVGLGAFSVVHRMEGFRAVADGIYWLIAAGALALGVFSIKDAVAYRREARGGAMVLKVPEAARGRMHAFMRERVQGRFVLVGCFMSGAAVAVLEVVCTGQIYLPTIMVIARDPVMRPQGIGYLALYNVMFIAPLLAVLGLMLAGVKWQRFLGMSRRSVVMAKLLLAILFFVLGGVMIVSRIVA